MTEHLPRDDIADLMEDAELYSSRADDCGRLARKVLDIREALKAQATEIERLRADAERLEWLQFRGARVCWGNDDEVCSVRWTDRSGEEYETRLCYDWREAIDAAMRQGEKT
jgi:hypothetical protein